MKENAKKIIEDSLNNGSEVVVVDCKNGNLDYTRHKIVIGKTSLGMTFNRVARECRKFGTAFPKPSTHKL